MADLIDLLIDTPGICYNHDMVVVLDSLFPIFSLFGIGCGIPGVEGACV